MKRFIKLFGVLCVSVILCLSIAGCELFILNTGSIDNLPDSATLSQNVTFNTQTGEDRVLYTDDADVADKVARSVVAIRLTKSNGASTATSTGSGVIVDVDTGEQGVYYVLTCHHVISSAGSVAVYIPDNNYRNFTDSDYDFNYGLEGYIGGNYNAYAGVSLVGGDKDGDVAVLRINVNGRTDKNGNPLNILTAKVAGDETVVRYGEKVFAIGNPSGSLPMTFMSGNISYIERETTVGSVGIMSLYQHDVMINHGSSGGGLFNMYGELIGITNAGSEEYPGLNYAIPYKGKDGFINVAKELIATKTATNYGYVTGRWELGITIQSKTNGDVYVASVVNGSNAMKSGLVTGDVITSVSYEIDGEKITVPITEQDDFRYAIFDIKESLTLGDSFEIVVNRNLYGQKTITMDLSVNYIFCDTGFYPLDNE